MEGPVTRVLRILRAIAEDPTRISVSLLAERLDLPRSSAHRFLQAFAAEDIVLLRDGAYVLGPEAYRLGSLLAGGYRMRDVALPVINKLVETVDETCLLGVYLPSDKAMMFAEKRECSHAIKYTVEMHRPLSLAWGASGKAIAAHLSEDERRSLLQSTGAAPASGTPLPTFAEFEEECDEIRRRGYALTWGEKSAGAVGFASAIFSADGSPCGCICLTMPEYRFDNGRAEELGELVASHAREVSTALGMQER